MIYLTIRSEDILAGNKKIKDDFDKKEGDKSFVVNMSSEKNSKDYCLISIPNDGSPYCENMKKHFEWTEKDPRVTPIDPPDEKNNWGHTHVSGVEGNRIILSDKKNQK